MADGGVLPEGVRFEPAPEGCYIPLSPYRRSRSIEIWRVLGERLGRLDRDAEEGNDNA